mmetsp:Transcript_1923/g.5720  ORF Transcript_1923/g.5720 Transcript_1923/m.5720 type:complete len:549 (-) Transcript_1923:2173-3819(-)|eukprot:CAMPEP_0206135582 /NCGR_PEP_ID=MMETSP1473-20131121/849_1 /ASSEMBLY_ACC=CAM_ASM_001109 /TAXON_ID=1461547 /ORGANISM="Stichococcus sp, Strain RCC1054" /LENGTH=548 /DNA_ID=CAMNT_0053527527 /DNA_START=191 /DNA_END=1837 /DNA_ORIENTATION=+
MAPSHELQKDTDDQDEAGAPKEGAKRKSAAPTKQAGKKPKSEPVSGSRKQLVQPKRWKELKGGEVGEGPVIYWMSRDQRAKDNWALLHAFELAAESGGSVAVAFNLVTAYLNAGARQFGFMIRGLQELEARLDKMGIPFFLLKGDPSETIPKLVRDTGAAALVTDFGPLRLGRQWRETVTSKISVPFHEVDAHNIVPVWEASPKRETGARTIRTKIHKLLGEYLIDYPEVPKQSGWSGDIAPETVQWDDLLAEALERGKAVPEITWCKSGEDAAWHALTHDAEGFLSKERLSRYESLRNKPSENALSGMSPYFHFGQMAPQRAALEAAKHRKTSKASVDGFHEEMIVRRELSDNFCLYEPNYDNIGCAAPWARESLDKHRSDAREYIYTLEQLEKGETHDELWNACQLEMVHLGKMHGFMRMYWAKKILEWTESPEQAIEFSIYLNDRYEIDGRDPNGYVGIMWAICGVHDQGWAERAVFGKIRYMNYNGCKRKFDIAQYCKKIQDDIKKNKGGGPAKESLGGIAKFMDKKPPVKAKKTPAGVKNHAK